MPYRVNGMACRSANLAQSARVAKEMITDPAKEFLWGFHCCLYFLIARSSTAAITTARFNNSSIPAFYLSQYLTAMSCAAYKLVVTKPCNKDWASMTKTESGRYCNSCSKTVIDFSILSDEEIKSFFINNNNNPVCGKFNVHQIDRIRIYIPAYVLNKRIPFWKKFLIIFLIFFGSNLYPFDTMVGNPGNLYAQSLTDKPTGKAKNPEYKKRKPAVTWKKKKEISFIDTKIETMILGFTQTILTSVTVPFRNEIHPRIDSPSSKPVTAGFSSSYLPQTRKQKRLPEKPASDNNKEYILPEQVKLPRRKR